MTALSHDFAARASILDANDPLGDFPGRFVGSDDPAIVAYLDGNSLGRPTRETAGRMAAFVTEAWGGRLIRGWDEGWFDLPLTLGDRIGASLLGAAAGQTAIGDSTSVLLYKLARGALALRPGRTEIVLDRDNFPTDRYLMESIAEESGMTLRWIDADFSGGVTVQELTEAVSERTALVVLSHVAYRSGFLLDAPAIVDATHDAGALLLLDVCHSVGAVEIELDSWGVDFAAGCTYKYLNGGPGAPAFGYVNAAHLPRFQQPIWGWMGREDPFEMAQGYVPAPGIRRLISASPGIAGMIPIQDTLDLIEEAGMPAIRAKSLALTGFALDLVQQWLAPRGVTISSPLNPARRGGHVTIDHPRFREITTRLWQRGVIPDFRLPHGIRIGMSPLSTTFREALAGVTAIRDELDAN
ncbi:aminotransferase class V-fold PLP-dependent enzyme [Nocardia sp. NPDC051030]|uniref:kynureninase n=1 Tax=Nocardia sp. NPDC051030 TaxID=3155162 RepID=UPI003418362C